MESDGVLSFFDELDGNGGCGFGSDVVDPTQLGQDFESTSYSPVPVTLAALNDFPAAENERLFNFGLEDGAIFDDPFQTGVSVEPEGSLKMTSNLRSPSPMSVTASVSGSESYSLCSPNRSDVDDTELFELLQDSGIQANDSEEHEATSEGPDMLAEPAIPGKSSTRRSKSRSSSSTSSSSSSSSLRGVSHQSGPWCKTKNRNNSKNAIAARENRERKKQYIASLEEVNAKLTEENTRMKKESAGQKRRIDSLESEVGYLRKVLFNQSALAGLLKRLNQKEVSLSSNFNAETSQGDVASTSVATGGICLHTDGEDTCIRFCSHCARKDQP